QYTTTETQLAEKNNAFKQAHSTGEMIKLSSEISTLQSKQFENLTTQNSLTLQSLTLLNDKNALYPAFEPYQPTVKKQYASYLAHFSCQDWSMYKHTQADLYLLIPKTYEERALKNFSLKNDPKTPTTVTSRELTLGLAVDHADMLAPLQSEKDLFSELKKTWETITMKILGKVDTLAYLYFKNRPVAVDALKNFFIVGKGNEYGYWNIYLIGHGWYSRTQYMQKAQENGNNQDPRATIAGLPSRDFFKVLSFCAHDIQTASLYYVTCFGGGYHQDLVARSLHQINEEKQLKNIEKNFLAATPVDFMVISGALTDAVTWNTLIMPAMLADFSVKKPLFDFTNYFAGMRTFFEKTVALATLTKVTQELLEKQTKPDHKIQSPEQKKERVSRLFKLYIKHENLLKETLSYLSPWQQMGVDDLHGIAGVPSLWYP
ncbi:MAG: hypothetical protein U1E02_06540, partial [Hydrogenophaga sp.]|nr:hypothetical protein [Hydrogenophaga sp.]